MLAAPTSREEFQPLLAVGLMSGTSADGVDAAALRTDGEASIQRLGGITISYEPAFRATLIRAASEELPLEEILAIEDQLTRAHAHAVQLVCEAADVDSQSVDVIGFHGHTIRHLPDQQLTWQIGNGSLLAQLTGRPVVFDFRRRDMAAGGEGAPLAPLYHQAVASGRSGTQLFLNLGGVGNVTWINGDQIIAGDTGPGCGLLDAWVQNKTGAPFDQDGQLAAHGQVEGALVEATLAELPFFARPLPKSADRFEFDSVDVSKLSVEDGAATLCAITIAAVVQATQQLPTVPQHVWVTGGGRHHPLMMQLLRGHFSHVAPIDELGHDGDFVEAECFGWLAVRRLRELSTSRPETTGAAHATCAGALVVP